MQRQREAVPEARHPVRATKPSNNRPVWVMQYARDVEPPVMRVRR